MRNQHSRRLLLALVAAAVAALALAATASAANHVYSFSFGSASTVPANPYPIEPNEAFRMAVDNSGGPSDGDIYVLDTSNHRVEKFDPEGHLLLMFGNEVNKTASENPGSTDVEENVCVIASGDICQDGVAEFANDAFQRPRAITVDNSPGPSQGDIYVSETECCLGDYVTKWDEDGHQVKTWGGKEGKKQIFFVAGLTVERSSGDLFAVGNGEMERFNEAGQFLNKFVFPGRIENSVDIDSNGVLFGISQSFEQPGLLKFSQAGSLIATISQSAVGLSVDPESNDVYSIKPDFPNGAIAQYDNFCGNLCAPIDSFGKAQDPSYGAIAFGTSDERFYSSSGGDKVAVYDAVTPKILNETFVGADEGSADFSATIDPNGNGPVTECELQFGALKSLTFTDSVPCTPDPSGGAFSTPTGVTAHIEGLAPGNDYRYRFVAHSATAFVNGVDRKFRSASRPRITSFTATHITGTDADLEARIIPSGADTTYRFEYGPTTNYGNTAPIPEGDLTEDLFDEQFITTNIEFDSQFTYHFRLVAENVYGTTVTDDQTFNFYPPTCPNLAVRQQTGANDVPDCRGYELVTPEYSGNATIFPAGSTPNLGSATTPSRVGYGTWGGIIPGIEAEPPNTIGDQYVATRTNAGWKSKYIGLPSTVSRLSGGPPYRNEINGRYNWEPDKYQQGVLADPGMDHLVDWNGGQYQTLKTGSGEPYLGQGPGRFSSNAPYVWNSSTGKQVDRWPTNLGAVPGGEDFKGETIASGDLSHFIFSSDIPFAPGGEPEDIYDNETSDLSISIASRDQNGDPVLASPATASLDGSHILMTTPKPICGGEPGAVYNCVHPFDIPVRILLRVDGLATYDVTQGNLVRYVGATTDFTKVYFVSAAKLVAEDTDSSKDLYMWSEAGELGGEPLTLVSIADDESTGNSDSCNAGWTDDCDALPIDFEAYCKLQGGLGGNCVSDRSIGSESGDVYFFSPEKLDGAFGIADAANLYRFHDGDINFVASLAGNQVCTPVQGTPYCSESPISRMNVAPDGKRVAFITTSQLTEYDNGGHSVMYTYTPASEQIICVSCRPDGLPPSTETIGSQNGLFMTDDGRTFFSTKDALVPKDTNQGTDIYEYTEGRPQLISSGTAAENENFGFTGIETFPGLDGVSADGTDVYFVTYDVLVGQDQNGEELKIYDARVNGGFPFVKPPPECAAADECHGPGSSAVTMPTNGTGAGLGDRGNVQEAKKKTAAKKKKAKKGRKKRHAKRGGQNR